MPNESQLAHRVVRDTNQPYISNQSPIVTEPCYVPGSQDLMTSVNGYAERRPGFANTVEPTPTIFNNLQREFAWDDFNGNFFVMFCDINASGKAQVYKMQVGMDVSAVSIYTDTSGVPFDFVVSNGTVYFGNGVSMKKWNTLIGVQNWGIAVGSVNNSTGPDRAGAGANDTSSGTAWVNPNNVTSTVSYATVALNVPAGKNTAALSKNDDATVFSFSIPGTSSVLGILFTAEVICDQGQPPNNVHNVFLTFQLLKAGVLIGSPKSVNIPSVAPQTLTLGSSSDLWGTTWVPNDINQTNWGVAIQAIASNGSFGTPPGFTANFSIRNVNATIFGIGGPGIVVSGAGGTFSAQVGYEYVFCYGNSLTGHISSPTPASASSGPFGGAISTSVVGSAGLSYAANDTGLIAAGNGVAAYKVLTVDANGAVLTYSVTNAGATYLVQNQTPTHTAGTQPGKGVGFSINITAVTGVANITVTLTASLDPQVNQIRVFRTTDSAAPGIVGGTLFEIPSSPFPNANANITDNAPDIQLNIFSVAPIPSFNDPPPPSQGMVYFSGRLWMFVGNKVWFTGLEEIVNGVPEESVPSGIAGNFWTFDENVQALGVAGTGNNQTLGILCGGRLYGIQGNTLDTFRRFLISNRRGCRNRTCVTMMGGMLAWLDTANQVWATDGNSLQELSIPIRPDLVGITQVNCSMSFHTQGRFHWLLLSTGTNLFVYDVDTEQWMPPWSFACQYLSSGETSPGNYQLMASIGTRALSLSTTAFNDNGNTYSPVVRTNLFGIVPDFGRRFSYVAAGMYDEPSRTGQVYYVQVDTNNVALADVLYIIDDDPTLGTYVSLTKDATTVERAFNRFNKTNVQQHVYAAVQPTGRWYGIQINLANADQHDEIFGWYIAYKSIR